MAVAFDARMARHSGIGTHIRGLLRGLRDLDHGPEMLLLGDLNVLLPLRLHRGHNAERYTAPIYSLPAQWRFPRRWPGAQALHVPHYNIPLRYADPLIVTIHDLIHLLFPDDVGSLAKRLYARYVFGRVAARADRILCVSRFTADTVIERLRVAPDRVVVAPNAVDPAFRPSGDPAALEAFRQRRGLPSQYLLVVSIDKPHKNLAFLVEALAPWWDRAKAGAPDLPLVVAGTDPDGPPRRTPFEEAAARRPERVIRLGRLPDAEMPLLYEAAAALVIPSLYEGFGLPALEAQRAGAPVVSSKAASLPEVAGDGALFFDPADGAALRDALRRALEDSAARAALVEAGRRNEARYSWADTARTVAGIYREAV